MMNYAGWKSKPPGRYPILFPPEIIQGNQFPPVHGSLLQIRKALDHQAAELENHFQTHRLKNN
jgi:hypothetical protein